MYIKLHIYYTGKHGVNTVIWTVVQSVKLIISWCDHANDLCDC